MSEFILGVGQQQSVRDVMTLVEREIYLSQGQAKKIVARAGVIEVTAERPDFGQDLSRYMLRLKVIEKAAQKLRDRANEYVDCCSIRTDDEGFIEIICPLPDMPASDRTNECVDRLSRCVTLPDVWRSEGMNFKMDRLSPELLFQALLKYKASDVHLSPGVPPIFRIDNEIHFSELVGPLSAAQITNIIKEIAPKEFWQEFKDDKQTSFNYHQAGLGYARTSAFMKNGAPHCTFRYLPETIPSFEQLNIPKRTMVELAGLHRGLLLVTGMTGSGKSTTAAALVDWINTYKAKHILTIENPVEYVHKNKKSVLSQRSLGSDVTSFSMGVTGALRHDPDVILIGEMRDPDTIRAAINAAATGHLVISTLHANTASEVVNRVVSFFDPVERDLVKLQLRDCIQCVICQRLLPRVGGGRVPALEIMLNDVKPIADGIKAGDTDMIRVGMQQTVSHSFIFEQYLFNLFKANTISIETAQEYSTDQSIFDQINMGTYSVPRLDSIRGG